jgi:putative transposase
MFNVRSASAALRGGFARRRSVPRERSWSTTAPSLRAARWTRGRIRTASSFIRPGKPIENAYVESFNGKFRDECLNEHWFLSVAEAKTVIEGWRVDYNTVRSHGALDQRTPAAYAAVACAGPKPGCGACSAPALASAVQLKKSDGLSLSV